MNEDSTSSLACHDDVWLLLPWYVNQSLPDEEQSFIEEHLRVCVACRQGLLAQQRLQKKISTSATIELSEYIQFASLVEEIRATPEAE